MNHYNINVLFWMVNMLYGILPCVYDECRPVVERVLCRWRLSDKFHSGHLTVHWVDSITVTCEKLIL